MAKRKPRRPAAGTRRSARSRRPAGARRAATARASKAGTARRKRKSGRARTSAARQTRTAPKAAARPKRTGASRTSTGTGRSTSAPAPARKSAGRPKAKVLARRAGGEHRLQIDRERRVLREAAGPPSSLDLDRHASAARSGRAEIREALSQHTESSPRLTGGDVDANWASAFSTGDEAPGGDMPTPDQDVVEEIGSSLGVQYADDEELKAVDKIEERDRHRWELDPASAEDYRDRAGKKRE